MHLCHCNIVNRLLSTMSKRQGHLNACFIRVSFCVFITHFAKEEVKYKNDQGWFSVNIKPSITSCFDVLKPCNFYTKHKYLHLLRFVNHCTSTVTETIKTSCPVLRDLPTMLSVIRLLGDHECSRDAKSSLNPYATFAKE